MSKADVEKMERNEVLDKAEQLREWRKEHGDAVEKIMDGILSLVKNAFIDLEKLHNCPVSARKLRLLHKVIGSIACQALGEIEGVPFEPAAPEDAPLKEPDAPGPWPGEHPKDLLHGYHCGVDRADGHDFQRTFVNEPTGEPDGLQPGGEREPGDGGA